MKAEKDYKLQEKEIAALKRKARPANWAKCEDCTAVLLLSLLFTVDGMQPFCRPLYLVCTQHRTKNLADSTLSASDARAGFESFLFYFGADEQLMISR